MKIRFDYYREANSYLEAFKRGLLTTYAMNRTRDAGR